MLPTNVRKDPSRTYPQLLVLQQQAVPQQARNVGRPARGLERDGCCKLDSCKGRIHRHCGHALNHDESGKLHARHIANNFTRT